MRRTRLIPLAGGVALLAAACLGPPAVSEKTPGVAPPVTQYCASRAPDSPAGYQAAFDGLRHSTDWLSADTAVPVALPDGRTVWLFGDTYIGGLTSIGSIDPSGPFMRNSLVMQSGACLTALTGGRPGARTSLIPAPAAGEWYWPASGVVENGMLRVFLWHVQGTGPGEWDFTIIDMRVATFSLPLLQFEGVRPLPFPTSYTQPYGATALVPGDGYVYLYGAKQRNVFVARAPLGQVMTPGAWQFWGDAGAGPTWTPNATSATPLQWTNMPPVWGTGSGQGPNAQPWVRPYGTGYLATAKLADVVSDDVSVFTARSPQGPWTYYGRIATTSSPGLISYGAWTGTLPGTSTPTVAYSTNLASPASQPLSGQTYGPHFFAPLANSMPPP